MRFQHDKRLVACMMSTNKNDRWWWWFYIVVKLSLNRHYEKLITPRVGVVTICSRVTQNPDTFNRSSTQEESTKHTAPLYDTRGWFNKACAATPVREGPYSRLSLDKSPCGFGKKEKGVGDVKLCEYNKEQGHGHRMFRIRSIALPETFYSVNLAKYTHSNK